MSVRKVGGMALPFAAAVLAAASGTPGCRAQVPSGTVQFDDAADAIQISGDTVLGTTATFEARFFLPTGASGTGFIFNEWTSGFEDKALGVGADKVVGFVFETAAILQHLTSVSLDTWHHVAFVHDGPGSEQRLYLDGTKIASQSASGDVSDGENDGLLGGIFRDASLAPSFLGYLDTFRVSDNARYSGDSFTPPAGDLADDANTLVLYNFAANDFTFAGGMATVADLSGNGHTGTLGAGFSGVSYPGVPGTLDVDGNGSLGALTDGLMILRFAFGFTGSTIISGAVDGGCTRCDAATIEPYIAALAANLDIDDNDDLTALTDGLLVLRYLFGFTGTTLTNGAVGAQCNRCNAAAIEPYLQLID